MSHFSRLLIIFLLSGFASFHAVADTYVYVSESKDKKIAIFSLDQSNGNLARIGEIEMKGSPGCLAISANKKYLYAAVRSTAEFATLSINPESGLLAPVSTSKSLGSAAYIYPDKTGKWLLAAYYAEGLASVSKIVDGIVTGNPVQAVDIGKKAHCIQTDPANRFAFVPHPDPPNKVDQFLFNAEKGRLKRNSLPALSAGEGDGPRHMQFHPNGKWVYFVNEQSKSVTLCDYDAEKGTLKIRQTQSTVPSDWDGSKGSCADIEISADGKSVYASNRGHDSIAMFSIEQSSGEISSLGQAATEKTPRSFNLIPGGEKFLVAAGQGNNQLAVYRRDPATGTLTKLKTYPCGKSPAWVVGINFAN